MGLTFRLGQIPLAIQTDTSNNVGIGGAANASYKLQVTGTTNVTGVLTLGSTISNGTYTYTLPSATGTLALTSALSAYLPLTGGTLTGALSGTSATFSGTLTDKVTNISADGAGVVLQGYVDNALRIAVRGSGYNDGVRGGLYASFGDFNSSITTGGDITIPNGNYYYSKRNTGNSNINILGFPSGSDTLTLRGGTSGAAVAMQFQDTGGTVMSLYNSNVGIGTSSPSNKLHILGTGTNTQNILLESSSSTGNAYFLYKSASKLYFTGLSSDLSNSYIIYDGTADIVRMTITSVGKVLIGTTASTGGAGGDRILEINGNIYSKGSSAGYFWEDRSNSANFYGWYTTGNTIFLYNGSANAASISPSTGIYTPLNPSDIRIKNNISNYNKGLNELLKIKVKEWEYNGKAGTIKGEKGVGFVANELEQAIPEWVGEFETYLDKEDTEKTKLKNININELPYLMINAIQELKSEIDELKALIAAK